MDIAIIGIGHMGLTYAQAFVHTSIVRPDRLWLVDPSPRDPELATRLSAHPVAAKPNASLREAKLVVLCVKPQDFAALAPQLQPYLSEAQLVLSVMAGVTLARLQDALGCSRVIRAMPNLPAQVGQGMTVFTAAEAVDRADLQLVHNLLSTTGKTLYVDNEALLDAATAVSGSGPGYVFTFMQALIDAAQGLGFSPAEALLLVRQTVRGSIELLEQSEADCTTWVGRVASRGGTTEAALDAFAKGGLTTLLLRGVEAAHVRASELAREVLPIETAASRLGV